MVWYRLRTYFGGLLGVPYNGSQFTAKNVGTISLDFNDAGNATMTTTVNGIVQSRHIERQPF